MHLSGSRESPSSVHWGVTKPNLLELSALQLCWNEWWAKELCLGHEIIIICYPTQFYLCSGESHEQITGIPHYSQSPLTKPIEFLVVPERSTHSLMHPFIYSLVMFCRSAMLLVLF